MAENSKMITLSKLDNKMRRPKIVARVLKIWDAMNPETGNKYSLDTMLIDNEGTTIEALTYSEDIEHIRPQIIEGVIFEFSNFRVMSARKNYRTVPHQYSLRFTQATTIKPSKEFTVPIPTHYFNFEHFENIGTLRRNPKEIVDAIGKIINLGPLQQFSKNNRIINIRDIQISNEREKTLSVTIWGDHNLLFDEQKIIEQSKQQPVVVAFSSVQLKEFQSTWGLKTYSGTRIFQDDTILEISNFKKSISKGNPITIPDKQKQTYSQQQTTQEPLLTVTIKELLDNYASNSTVQNVNCIAKIVDIDETEGWFYNTCGKHTTKVKVRNHEYRCDECMVKIETPQPWYKFCAIVADENEEAYFILLGRKAEQIIGCTALALQIEHDTAKGFIPDRINSLIGKKFNFIVRYNPLSAKIGRTTFTVIKVSPVNNEDEVGSSTNIAKVDNSAPITLIKPIETRKRTESCKEDIATTEQEAEEIHATRALSSHAEKRTKPCSMKSN